MIRNICIKKKTVWIIGCAFLLAVAVGLPLILVKVGQASQETPLNELERKSLAEVKELVPEAVAVALFDDSLSNDSSELIYNLKDQEGKNIGVIMVDPTTEEVTYFYDARGTGSTPNVKVSLEQARELALDFLKEKGIDPESIAVTNADLESKGMQGDAENPTPTYIYSFEFAECVDGVILSGIGDACFVWVSPEDGRILSYGIHGTNVSYADKTILEVKLDKENAIAIAVNAAHSMKGVPKTKPYCDDKTGCVLLWDEVDGTLIPYYTITLLFGEKDMVDTFGVTIQVDAIVNANTGEIMHIDH